MEKEMKGKEETEIESSTVECDESPDDIKSMCLGRIDDLLVSVSICLTSFDQVSDIPRDLVNLAEEIFPSIFGADSREIKRYADYSGRWNSFNKDSRLTYLENLRADLLSARKKLELTPSRRYPILGYGAIENERIQPGVVAVRLGIQKSGSEFNTRLMETSRRLQVCMQRQCYDAAAFYLRKILEGSIIERFKKDGKAHEITVDGHFVGLEKLIGKASRSASGDIEPRTVKSLLDDKLLMDASVHSWGYEPTLQETEKVMSLLRMALTDLRIGEL